MESFQREKWREVRCGGDAGLNEKARVTGPEEEREREREYGKERELKKLFCVFGPSLRHGQPKTVLRIRERMIKGVHGPAAAFPVQSQIAPFQNLTSINPQQHDLASHGACAN